MNDPTISVQTSCGKSFVLRVSELSDRQLTILLARNGERSDVDPTDIAAMRAELQRRHVIHIGLIVLRLAQHEPGDFGDGSLNDPIVNLIDLDRPAGDLVRTLGDMSTEHAAGLADYIRREAAF